MSVGPSDPELDAMRAAFEQALMDSGSVETVREVIGRHLDAAAGQSYDPYSHGFARQRLYTALSGVNDSVPETESLIHLATVAAELIEAYRALNRRPR